MSLEPRIINGYGIDIGNYINNTRSIKNPKLLSFILIIHHVLKRTCFLINYHENTDNINYVDYV